MVQAPRLMLQIVASLTDKSRGITYNLNVLIVQATCFIISMSHHFLTSAIQQGGDVLAEFIPRGKLAMQTQVYYLKRILKFSERFKLCKVSEMRLF